MKLDFMQNSDLCGDVGIFFFKEKGFNTTIRMCGLQILSHFIRYDINFLCCLKIRLKHVTMFWLLSISGDEELWELVSASMIDFLFVMHQCIDINYLPSVETNKVEASYCSVSLPLLFLLCKLFDFNYIFVKFCL